MRFRDSFWAVLGRDAPDSREAALDRVRNAMLALVDEIGGAEGLYKLDAKINFANDIAELWHVRPDLMHAVSQARGEEAALVCMGRITQLFGTHHLGGKSSRFSDS